METIEDYNKAILKFCQDNPGLQIYNAGTVSHPGISDLDFLVLDRQPVISEEVDKFLLGGNVIIMPSHIFSKINYLEQFELNLLQGKAIQIEKVSSRYFDIIEILEWLPERILLIESVLKEANPNTRQTLLYLKSLDKSIKNVEKLTTSYFSRPRISEVRDNFKNYSMISVCNDYHNAAQSAWYTFSSSLKEISGIADGSVCISGHYTFSDRFEKLMIYMTMLLNFNLEISSALGKRVNLDIKKCEIDTGFIDFAKYRWKILNETYCWFKSNNIKSGMVKYGWLLK